MNKEDLVNEIAKATKLSKKDTELAVNTALESITAALKGGEKVTLVGFGTFAVRERAAREGRNPRTGAALKIAAKKAPAFTPGKGLKDAVGGPKPVKKGKK